MADDISYIDQVDCRGGVPVRTPSGSPLQIEGKSVFSSASSPIQVTATHTQLVEGQSGQGGVYGNFSGLNFIKATGTVKSSAGFLNNVVINRVTQTTLRIYDTTTILSTTLEVMRNTVGTLVIPAGNTQFIQLPYQRKFTRGLRFLMTTTSDLSFSFR